MSKNFKKLIGLLMYNNIYFKIKNIYGNYHIIALKESESWEFFDDKGNLFLMSSWGSTNEYDFVASLKESIKNGEI